MKNFPELPVFQHLDTIKRHLTADRTIVIEAEPGAGKTMLIPALLREISGEGMTLLVEPRRIAARAAACGIARMHGWEIGRETGFSVRGEHCRCRENGILAVTPGILLQMLQHDPVLEDVSGLIFDEFHERSMENDLALALVLDMRESLREDLRLAVMSATMDSDRNGRFLHAPVVRIPGRSFPVKISYQEIPPDLRELPVNVARTVLKNLAGADGDILIFLPGLREINVCREILEKTLEPEFVLHSLHGSLPLAGQQAALAPAPPGKKKIILATNVAESSLTIDGVTMVIDSGWEKQPVWHPGSQMNFLENRRITGASAGQRAGRAGRTAPGQAVRCYSKVTFDNLIPEKEPELLSADLAGFLLMIRCWGSEISQLRWLDMPPDAAVNSAEKLLKKLALLTPEGRPTASGRRAAGLPLHPRLAAMMIAAPPGLRKEAAKLAACLEEKDDHLHFNSADLNLRLSEMHSSRKNYHIQHTVAARLLQEFPPGEADGSEDSGLLIAAAFPEWIGRNRSRHGTVYQLSGGGGACLAESDYLREAEFLAIARLDGSSGGGNNPIRLALPVKQQSLEKHFAHAITSETVTFFDPESGRTAAFSERKLGSLVLNRTPAAVPPGEAVTALLKEAFRRNIQLPPPEDKRGCSLLKRIRFAGNCGTAELPEKDEELILALAPYFPEKITTFADLKKVDWYDLLGNITDYAARSEIDRLCPEYFTAPTGMKFAIDYSGEQPVLAIQIQQLYGVKVHPVIGKNRLPLKIELLSPARRPVQITSDLPGFWQGSWKLVRSEMRSRYPKHEWPEDPANAQPMRRSIKQ